MDNPPLVSIALCTYNGSRFLEQLLDTVTRQTYPNIEIIAVDDCSTDGSFDILLNYCSMHSFVSVYQNEANIGFVRNFERALTYCRGDLIAFCDQDDLWELNKIELQVAALGDNVLIYHDSEFIDEQNKPLNKRMSDLFNFYRGDDPLVFLFFNCISGHSMLVKKQLLDDARPFMEGFYHDWWLAYAATNQGSIDFLPECLVKYRQHVESDTDLLKRKEVGLDKQSHMEIGQIYKMRAERLRLFAGYSKNKNPELIKLLYSLYKNRVNNYLCVRLAVLMEKNISTLYYIQKKSRSKKIIEVAKLLWGFKTKNFWYKFIKPNQRKIIQ